MPHRAAQDRSWRLPLALAVLVLALLCAVGLSSPVQAELPLRRRLGLHRNAVSAGGGYYGEALRQAPRQLPAGTYSGAVTGSPMVAVLKPTLLNGSTVAPDGYRLRVTSFYSGTTRSEASALGTWAVTLTAWKSHPVPRDVLGGNPGPRAVSCAQGLACPVEHWEVHGTMALFVQSQQRIPRGEHGAPAWSQQGICWKISVGA